MPYCRRKENDRKGWRRARKKKGCVMKLLGLQRDSTTLSSTPDTQGWEYSASFEFYPFYEGKHMAVYKDWKVCVSPRLSVGGGPGIVNGWGPRRGELCVVKARVASTASRGDWRLSQDVARTARSLAASFNCLLQSPAILFQWPLLAQLDTLSDFIPLFRLFKPHHKRLTKGEAVLIEEFIEGEFERFSSNVGWVQPESRTDVTQAFSHYTWHVTRELVVCGLQGVASGHTFHLTTPTIHSSCCRYGTNDGGFAAIEEFFANHRCNNICSTLSGLDVPDCKSEHGVQVDLDKSQRPHNRRRKDCNVHSAPRQLCWLPPKLPSAPLFESTRF